MGGRGGGLHHTMVALKLQQFQLNFKIFFGAFGTQYFLCFFVKVTVPRGGVARGGGRASSRSRTVG